MVIIFRGQCNLVDFTWSSVARSIGISRYTYYHSVSVTTTDKLLATHINVLWLLRTSSGSIWHYLARSANLPEGLYILLALISFFLLWAKLSQYLLDRFSRSFHQMEGICVDFLDPVQFFRFLNGRCHGNQFSGKNGAKLPTPCTYRSVIRIRNGLSLSQCAR